MSATWLVLVVLRGPDPCLPIACPDFGWSFLLGGAPGLTVAQVVALVVGVTGACVLLAFASVHDHRGLLASVLVVAAIPLFLSVASSSSARGTWFDAEAHPQDGRQGRSSVDVEEGCAASILVVDLAPGAPRTPGGRDRWYSRDLLPEFPSGQPDLHATLPNDALDSGFRRGHWHPWFSPGRAFLTNGDVTEAWPLVPHLGCDAVAWIWWP